MDFELFWKTYLESFPPDERRSREQQVELTQDSRYHIYEIEHSNRVVGFIAYWDFCDFLFIEHFALSEEARGKGAGSAYLTEFLKVVKTPVILEVEPPQLEIQHRRVAFYQRLGFHLSEFTHIQKAYVEGRKGVLLQLMSYPEPMDEALFNCIENTLFSTIYKD